jgi:cytochrome P450
MIEIDYVTVSLLLGLAAVPVAIWSTPTNRKLSKIPGPTMIPFVGDLSMCESLSKNKNHEHIDAYRKRYGDIYRVEMFGHPFITVSDADAAKTIFTSKSFIRDDLFERAGKGILDNALFIMKTDQRWKLHRKLLQPAFGPSHLRDTALQTEKVIQNLLDILEARMVDNSVVVDMHQTLTNMTLDVIGLVAFGINLESIKGEAHENSIWSKLTDVTLNRTIQRLVVPFFMWPLVGLGVQSPKVVQARNELHSYMRKLVEDAKLKLESSNDSDTERWGLNVLERLIQSELSIEEIYGEMVGFFIAGHETTSNLLTFAVFELCNNPDIQERLYKEIVELEGDYSFESINKLSYLDRVIKETLRLHSIVPIVDRYSVEETELLGYKIPAGLTVSVNILGIHRNEKYYKMPNTFDPDRWLDDTLNPHAFVPFSDGPHNCIGKKMALIEAKIILSSLVRFFRFESVDQVIDITSHFTTSITGYKSKIIKRL